ncbi:hypothetical protein M569_09432 [Genlisea aurea]|uniref:Uncharacterized protein n=1 Tax=Genlisea aurea TaxID=192259 RepID=S8DQP5_9LAMI|nr:hypothetical protein M569_09432 [Genlisea aurea]
MPARILFAAEGAMAVTQAGIFMFAAAILVVFALMNGAAAQEAPAPAPTSSSGIFSPSVGFAFVSAVFSFVVFSRALRI